jgi:hypothetical protein
LDCSHVIFLLGDLAGYQASSSPAGAMSEKTVTLSAY